jgi:PAS domain S-box-containing protein
MELPVERKMITKHNHFRTHAIRTLHSFASGFLLFLFIAVFCLFSAAAAEVNFASSMRLATPLIDLTTEERAWLSKHPDIVLGAPTNYPPMVIKRADGTHVGVLVDLFEQISRRLNTRISLHIEDSWAAVQQKAENREIDGLAFGGRDPNRRAYFNPTDTVMPTYFSVFARSQNEYQLKSFSDLKGMRVGFKGAARPTRSLLETLPEINKIPYDSHEAMTQALLTKEVDVLVAWMSYDHWRKDKLQGTIDNVLLIDEYPIEMVTHIRKDWPELIPILNKAITALQQEELPRLINKWFGQWPLKNGATRVSLTSKEQAWLKAHSEITLGTSASYPPNVVTNPDSTYSGVLPDLYEKLSQVLGTRISLHIGKVWIDVQQKAQNRDLDGLAIGGRDPKRDALYNATDTIYPSYFSVFARSQNDFQFKNFSDLDGLRIGYKRGAIPAKTRLEKLPSATIKPYDNHQSMTQALLSREIDVIVAWMSYDHWRKKTLQGTIDNILMIEEYPLEMVIYVRKDWPELVPILNKAIGALQQEELPRIIEKWFGQWPHASTAPSVPLTPEDKAWVEAYPELAPMAFKIRERVQLNDEEREWLQTKTKVPVRVGDYPPFFFVADGKPQGVSIDYVQLVCIAYNLDCDYMQGLTIADSILMMKRPGGIAIHPGWQKNAEREKVALFTGTYVDSPFVIFQHEGSERARSIEDLVGKRVVVEKNYAIHQLLKNQFPELHLVEVDVSTEAIKQLAKGKADAYVSSLMAGYYMSLAHGYPNIVVAAPAPFEPNRLEIAVRRDWPELASIITKSIAAMRPEEHQNILKGWMSINYQEKIDYTLLWKLMAAAGFVLLAVIYWNKQLSRKVAARTSELSASESRFRSTFEQAAVGIAHVSKDGVFQRVNCKFRDIMGYSKEEMLKLTFQEITHPDDLDNDLAHIQQVLKKERENYSIEKRYYRKDGSIVWVNLTVSLVFDRGYNPKYFVLVIKDISDRKKMEKSLLLSHVFLEHLTTSVPDAVFSVKMPERTIDWANDSYDILGYEVGECVDGSTEKFYASPEEYQRVGALLDDIIRGGKDVLLTEAMLCRKNGEVFDAEINAAVYRVNDETVNLTALVRDISKRKLAENKLNQAYGEIEQLQKRLQAESAYLQEEIKLEHNFDNIIGQSEALKYVLHRVEQVARLDSIVLILGETGTGKELIARALHKLSDRGNRPLVKVNCAALPSELIESELFGREKGAFTGATTTQIGRFELANGSTLFLDEIGELPFDLQAKLLRVIESGEFERLGASRTLKSDARIIVATNRNLEVEVSNNRFREDLLYRLKIFPITIPPLRDRQEDIPMLVNYFVQIFSRKMGRPDAFQITKSSMETLKSHSWPGNVRELQHVIEGALIGVQGDKLNFDTLKIKDVETNNFKSFEEMEREYILSVLKTKDWKIGGKDSAASILGMPPSTLRSRIKKLGLTKP